MNIQARIEQAMEQPFARADTACAPPRLMASMRHAVFPGGARIRPHLCLAVAKACGDDAPALADAMASAIELMHCASLVHDDMPCFDDADLRRGLPTVHKQFGQPLALLAGDGLIVLAFQTLAQAGVRHPERLAPLLLALCEGSGAPDGIVAGQAWECEPRVHLSQYQRAKTGALFVAATCGGAQAAGADPRPWRELGDYLGEAYQVADDIRDVMGATGLGKPTGQDAQHGRPSTAADLGLQGAVDHFRLLMASAVGSIPPCPSQTALRHLVRAESERLLPQSACEQIDRASAARNTRSARSRPAVQS